MLHAVRETLIPNGKPVTEKALRGRSSECGTLDRLIDDVRAGDSRALVLRGEPGVGKTALLDHVLGQASGCRVACAAGVHSEMEFAFAGLHQLCAPMLDGLDRLPEPQRDALGTAFGLSAGDTPDRFLVGLAVLRLLAEAAEDQPLICLVDDAQWLDRASAQALAFAARRLRAESVAVVFAARETGDAPDLTGLPELTVDGLGDGDARALLSSVIRGPLDVRVRDRIVSETRGNPLALMELPRGLTPAELAGGFGLPDALPLSGRIEESFRRRLAPLPAETQRLLLVAAAEAIGEPVLVWRAAERLGIPVEAAAPAAEAGLLEFGAQVRFRHPLVRSAVYRAASLSDRQSVHAALAEALDPDVDPDRRAWHRAHAAPGPDEDVAEELERSAGRAQARGGLAAAAAFLEQATELTLDPARRPRRALAAAQAKHQAGAHAAALELLATAEAGPPDELRRAQVDLLRAQLAFATNGRGDAPKLLLKAAQQLEPLDARLARETYLDAFAAAMFVGTSGGVFEVAQAARAAPPASQPPGPTDLLLDGLALLITEGYPAGTPMLQRALSAFHDEEISSEDEIRWLWLACHTAALLWEDEIWHVLSARHVQLARDAGALNVLPVALSSRIGVLLQAGEVAEAASLIEELDAVADETGFHLACYGALWLAVGNGREAEVSDLIDASTELEEPPADGAGLTIVQFASAVLYNGLGRYEEALAAAQWASASPDPNPALLELIEAASRTGKPECAADALDRISHSTRASGTDWALGTEARARALVAEGQAAEDLYREAIERLGRSRAAVSLARVHLTYGEWLRRERRQLDAREQLRTAHDMFAAMGLDLFAQRAAREMLATGTNPRKRSVETRGQLTAQETQVARLASEGFTNPEIGSQLFISPRTVEYHLHKVFAKLDISSRHQLDRVLSGDTAAAPQAA